MSKKNKFCVGDTIEIMKKNLHNIETEVLKMQTEDGTEVDSCPHSRQMIYATFSEVPEAGDIIRMRSSGQPEE